MKIAYILPNLQQAGPIILVQSLVKYLFHQIEDVCVYYIDESENPVKMDCEVHKIFYNKPFDFDRYDIIHCHTAKPDLYGFIWQHNMKHSLLITTIHQDSYFTEQVRLGKFGGSLYTSVWLAFQNRFDGLVTISEQTRDSYQKYFGKNLKVIYNGVNCVNGSKDKAVVDKIKAFKSNGCILLGTYALITKRKGLIQVLRMMVEHDEYKFVIIGNGPEVENLKSFTIQNSLQERVLFMSHIDKPYLYMDDIDIYMMPSYSEAFGLAMVEAAIQHKAIVCSDLPSFHEIFPDVTAGFFKKDDVESMHSVIQKVYGSLKNYADAAYNRANAMFVAERMADNYMTYYHKILQNSPHKISRNSIIKSLYMMFPLIGKSIANLIKYLMNR